MGGEHMLPCRQGALRVSSSASWHHVGHSTGTLRLWYWLAPAELGEQVVFTLECNAGS